MTIEEEKQHKKEELMQFAGICKGDFGSSTIQKLKQKKDA